MAGRLPAWPPPSPDCINALALTEESNVKIAALTKARPDFLERLPKNQDFVIAAAGADGQYSAEDLAKLADVDAFLVAAEPVHDQLLAACKKVKIVQRVGVGYDSLDLEATRRRGIPACNVAGVNKEAVAEHALAMILALAKRLPEADRLTRETDWGAARMLTKRTFELKGKTLGIVGFGDIGTTLGRRAKAFEMPIVYNDIRPIDAEHIEATGARFLEKKELFATADIISIHTTKNEGTLNMVNKEMLALMKPGAILICAARGGIVDEEALRDALNSGHLAGAGIDVFSEEPFPMDNPLLSAKNILLTPHTAGVSVESTARSMTRAIENIRRVVEKGEKPLWVVNGVG
jgi:phosphoglycerate dehydrogenase-like enzyme